MAYSLTVLHAALKDLDTAAKWYGEIHPKLAQDLVLKFQELLAEIQAKPFLSQTLNGGYRKLNLRTIYCYYFVSILSHLI